MKSLYLKVTSGIQTHEWNGGIFDFGESLGYVYCVGT